MFSKSYQITKEMYKARGWQIIKEDELTILAKVTPTQNLQSLNL